MLKYLTIFLLVVLSANFFTFAVNANEIPRKIISFYDPHISRGGSHYDKQKNKIISSDIAFTNVHHRAEVVLNHLGLQVEYVDITKALPPLENLHDYRGILLWFSQKNETEAGNNNLCEWLTQGLKNNLKLVILGGLDVLISDNLTSPCQKMLEEFQLSHLGNTSLNPLYLEITSKNERMVEFERKLIFFEGLSYTQNKVTDPNAEVFLKMKRKDLPDSESDLVFIHSKGGYVEKGYVNYEKIDSDKFHWRINPFEFFRKAFQTDEFPKPDTTTLNGNRIFYTHIDGDGLFNESHLDDEKKYSGEVIYQEILKKYSDVPFTVSIITGYMDQSRYQTERERKLYANIFSLNNVEAASHSYTHPLVWKAGKAALQIAGYQTNPQKEIIGSVEMMRDFFKQNKIDKPVTTFFWSGDCLPSEEILGIAGKAKLLNINGGDSRFDDIYDTYGAVSPVGIKKGAYIQIYSSNSNENTYTNLWEGPHFGYKRVIDTFKNTETPIRIKPMNIYYHFYSGEYWSSFKVLNEVYEYALTQNIFPVFTSRFIKIGQDFYKTKISKLNNGFLIKNDGDLQTIRFDNQKQNVDLIKSKGVLGFDHFQNNLYVFLDNSKEYEIYLTDVLPHQPYLINSNFDVENIEGDQRLLRFQAKKWYKAKGVIGGLIADRFYKVSYLKNEKRIKTNKNGQLEFDLNTINHQKVSTKLLVKFEIL